jgi:ubiquinone/menaquinone biosynthesis C-methylase UbiE
MKHLPTKSSLLAFDLILEQAEIKAGNIAADFGCGNSLFFLYALLTLVGEKGTVYAIDVLPQIIDTIKREIRHHNLNGIIPLQANLDQAKGLELSAKLLDKIFIISTLHQSSNSLGMISEAARVLKDDGAIVIVDWHTDSVHPLGPHHSRRLSEQAVIEAAETLGLSLYKQFKAGPYHYGLIFKKN